MPKIFTLGLFLFCLWNLQGQTILVLEKPGTARNFKYNVSDRIRIKLTSADTILSGKITAIIDSSLIINNAYPVDLKDVTVVYRSMWGTSLLQKAALIAGVGYLGISALNGLINNDSPVVPKETLVIGGSLTAAGLALIPFTKRRFRMDQGKWRLLILDFSKR